MNSDVTSVPGYLRKRSELPVRGPRLGQRQASRRWVRAYLRNRGNRATIAIPDDQTTNRRNRGSAGGRPPAFDTSIYRDRNAVERCINHIKQNKAVALRADKLAIAAINYWLRHG